MTFKTTTYVRQPFEVEAVEITAENMEEVADWVHGIVTRQDTSVNRPYIKLKAGRGYEGDFACNRHGNFRLYTRRAFEESFKTKADVDNAHSLMADDHPALLHRSAVDGQFVTEEEANANPTTTVTETG
jgi:hypothetical protein